MKKLNDYLVRWMYRDTNGELQTEIQTYYNQETSLTRMKVNCKRIADEKNWRLLDVQKLESEKA